MITEVKKHCGNCGEEILCNASEIGNCVCSHIRLAIQTREFLSKTYFDCLCNKCLTEFDRKITHAAGYSFPSSKEEFIEGIHYYCEGNMWVFTELYHTLKGSCCGNGCRHCIYGYKNRNRNS